MKEIYLDPRKLLTRADKVSRQNIPTMHVVRARPSCKRRRQAPISHSKSATENPCQLFTNDGPRRVGQQSDRVHVRFPTIAVVANSLITRSKETATHRCHEGVSRHRKGIGRCISSPQILLGWHQCAHQKLRCTSTPNNIPLPL